MAVVAPAIALPEHDRAPGSRDPPGQVEGGDPVNAAARKTAWGVPAPTPAAAAAANPGGNIIGGEASWPALVESKRGSKSASSESLKSSDGSGRSAQEDSIAASEPKPISTGSNLTATLPPHAAATASSQQNGSTTQPNPGQQSGNNGGTCGNGNSGSRRAVNSSAGGRSSGSGDDGSRNGGNLASGSSCNNSNGDGGINLHDNYVSSSGTSENSNNRNSFGNNHWNNNMRGVGSRSSNGDGNNRNSGGSSRNSNGNGGRGGYRGRRDHDRGANFPPRNYPRASVVPYQQQQPAVYHHGPFQRPPPPPPGHFMVSQPFLPYAPPFAYHVEQQFHNMHLVRPPMQPSWVPQDQPNLAEDIRRQIEFYFSTNNLCHDTYLRRRMNDQGWVSIELIMGFNRMRAFTGLVDANYILDAIQGSESLEVQGNNVRRRNGWAEWIIH
ncbi:hypothetical protein QOZ80_6AG0527850 [Eleusine coracana subsp. coracana]|nr:hypothetical protein QOZ80_6AG0527850 [Eleusine coracana subsp. coracana]